jgi:hypothetical protein
MHIPTIDEFCAGYGKKAMRKDYEYFVPTTTTVSESVVHLVNLRLVAAALKGDPIWSAAETERSPDTFMPARYARAVETIQAEKPIHMPWLSFKYGRIRITDGRHRLYALLDSGYTHARIVCDPWHDAVIRTLVDREDGGPEDSGYAEYMANQAG